MPLYKFQNQKTKEIIEVLQKMDDEHVFSKKDGEVWVRIFEPPQLQSDTKIDCNSYEDFVNKTNNKKGLKVGDLWEISEKASKEREQKMGVDPIKEKSIKDYEKQCKKKHPSKNKLPKKIEI